MAFQNQHFIIVLYLTAILLLAVINYYDSILKANEKFTITVQDKNITNWSIRDAALEHGNRSNQIQATNATPVVSAAEEINIPSLFETYEICYYFTAPHSTATHLWNMHLDQIFNSSHHPDMQNDLPTYPKDDGSAFDSTEADFMHKLLYEVLTPTLLRKGLVHVPPTRQNTHAIIKNVVNKIEKRIKDPENNPVLNIAVIGGSVVQGRGCYGNFGMNCAWPRRFEALVNQFLGMDVIKVHNLAIGGTHTGGIGTELVEFWLYPPELKKLGPDVIFNAYSVNDSLPNQLNTPEDKVKNVFENVHEHIQNFLRKALLSKSCGTPPLVVNLDDYLGPQQELLLGELGYNTAVARLAKWYDTVFLSYADVVRDVAYADTNDPTFMNKNDVHYGRWAHQTSAWLIGFGYLELMSRYCGDEYQARMTQKNGKGDVEQLKDDRAFFLPPPLTNQLLLKNISAEVAASKDATTLRECDAKTEHDDHNPCPLAWIASPGLVTQHRYIGWFMNRYKTEVHDWEVENDYSNGGWQGKFGWVATSPNATFTLAFDGFEKEVKTVTMIILRSYGEKWKDSQAQVTVSVDLNDVIDDESSQYEIVGTMNIWGVHNQTASPTVPETVDLVKSIPSGRKMKVKVEMVSGSTFKIMGMAFCNH